MNNDSLQELLGGSLEEFLGTAFLWVYTVNTLYLQVNTTISRSSYLKVSDKQSLIKYEEFTKSGVILSLWVTALLLISGISHDTSALPIQADLPVFETKMESSYAPLQHKLKFCSKPLHKSWKVQLL